MSGRRPASMQAAVVSRFRWREVGALLHHRLIGSSSTRRLSPAHPLGRATGSPQSRSPARSGRPWGPRPPGTSVDARHPRSQRRSGGRSGWPGMPPHLPRPSRGRTAPSREPPPQRPRATPPARRAGSRAVSPGGRSCPPPARPRGWATKGGGGGCAGGGRRRGAPPSHRLRPAASRRSSVACAANGTGADPGFDVVDEDEGVHLVGEARRDPRGRASPGQLTGGQSPQR